MHRDASHVALKVVFHGVTDCSQLVLWQRFDCPILPSRLRDGSAIGKRFSRGKARRELTARGELALN